MTKIQLSVKDIFKIIKALDEYALSADDRFTLVEHSQSGIGSILEIEIKLRDKVKAVIEISDVENW